MTAESKSKAIIRQEMPINQLVPYQYNPNKMSDRAFDLLADNLDSTGLTENIVVWLKDGEYLIISGHHRWEAAKLKSFDTVPVAIITDPDFDEEAYKFQLMRHNMIKGELDPAGFMKLYESVAEKYSDEIMADLFGFADRKQFDKIVNAMSKQLPKEMQAKFKKAAKELKTIDGLSELLNTMFTKYGNTLDHGYMVVDFGGKDSLWVQMTPKRRAAAMALGQRCIEEGRTMDDLLGGLLEMVATGGLNDQLVQLIANSKPVQLSGDFWPTQDTVTKA